ADRRLERAAAEVDLQPPARPRADNVLERLDEARRADAELLRLVEQLLRIGGRTHTRDEEPQHQRRERRERVELRIEVGDRELHLGKRLAGERERGRNTEPVTG